MAASITPQSKGQAGGYGGALAIVLIWIAGLFGLEMPPEVAGAITLLVAGLFHWIKSERPVIIQPGTGKRAKRVEQ